MVFCDATSYARAYACAVCTAVAVRCSDSGRHSTCVLCPRSAPTPIVSPPLPTLTLSLAPNTPMDTSPPRKAKLSPPAPLRSAPPTDATHNPLSGSGRESAHPIGPQHHNIPTKPQKRKSPTARTYLHVGHAGEAPEGGGGRHDLFSSLLGMDRMDGRADGPPRRGGYVNPLVGVKSADFALSPPCFYLPSA